MHSTMATTRPDGQQVTRTAIECEFSTHDGARLFYRHWPATTDVGRGAIVLFHRGHEHSGRVSHLVDELDLPEFEFFAWDARGHGRSPGARGFSPSFGSLVRDVQTFIEHLGAVHGVPIESVYIVAQSVGAVLVSTWVHDYAPKIRGMSLASPAFRVKLYVPLAVPGLRLLHKLRGNFFVNSYVKAKLLTHDAERVASYGSDPLITRPISVNILLGLFDAGERVVRDAQAITAPTQLLISGADWVVERKPQEQFFANLGSAVRTRLELPGFFHDTLGEAGRAVAVQAVRQFVLDRFAQPPQRPSLLQAHRYGASHDEANRLSTSLPALSPRGLYWASNRTSIRIGATLSSGMQLGLRTGFDSGSTLDYVYRNQAQGRGPLGRLIDRTYLDAVGWRGIRVRKQHLEDLLQAVMRRLRVAGRPVRMLDIAAGHGRYVLDAVRAGDALPEWIVLRDYSDINVQAGRRLIDALGLAQIARFEQADAFSPDSILSVQPRPSLAIVSGLYELFPDNDLVGRSLCALGALVEPGGWLVYTGQPWHPQLEMIARTLTSHRAGAAWIMRRRSQAEMDELVESAGFVKVAQRIDEWGIFTVSAAQRVDSVVA
jgi:alpha-beta hydrolase superfamily lysophospholipase